MTAKDYLRSIGVPDIPPALSPFDPGYDPATLESHLQQSGHLMSMLKISMACWMIADKVASKRKFEAARLHGVPTTTGGGAFEVAVAQGRLVEFLDLVASMGASRIECGAGFTDMVLPPAEVVGRAAERNLEVQFELGEKHDGGFVDETLDALLGQGQNWLDAGAVQLVVEARESAVGVGLFDVTGSLNTGFADRFVEAFGQDVVVFEAPTKPSQFALLDHFGPHVQLCNVRLEEILRVEIYRRGLHSDAFQKPNLRPTAPG